MGGASTTSGIMEGDLKVTLGIIWRVSTITSDIIGGASTTTSGIVKGASITTSNIVGRTLKLWEGFWNICHISSSIHHFSLSSAIIPSSFNSSFVSNSLQKLNFIFSITLSHSFLKHSPFTSIYIQNNMHIDKISYMIIIR